MFLYRNSLENYIDSQISQRCILKWILRQKCFNLSASIYGTRCSCIESRLALNNSLIVSLCVWLQLSCRILWTICSWKLSLHLLIYKTKSERNASCRAVLTNTSKCFIHTNCSSSFFVTVFIILWLFSPWVWFYKCFYIIIQIPTV